MRGNLLVAPVAELVDAHGLGPCLARGRGSTPLGGTKKPPVKAVFGLALD